MHGKAGRSGKTEKTERIVIRCDEDLYRRWRLFMLKNRKRFRTSADALSQLLDLFEEEDRRRAIFSY
jgi:hypothetical protein